MTLYILRLLYKSHASLPVARMSGLKSCKNPCIVLRVFWTFPFFSSWEISASLLEENPPVSCCSESCCYWVPVWVSVLVVSEAVSEAVVVGVFIVPSDCNPNAYMSSLDTIPISPLANL